MKLVRIPPEDVNTFKCDDCGCDHFILQMDEGMIINSVECYNCHAFWTIEDKENE